jgi:flagellar motor protein MotB
MTEQPRQPPDDDRDFERFLERSDPVSRAYGALGKEQPEEVLDGWIHTKAKHALRPDPLRKTSRRGWAYPVALAATLVLTVSVVLQLQEQAKLKEPAVTPAPAEPESKEDRPVAVDILREPASNETDLGKSTPKPAARTPEISAGGAAKRRQTAPPPERAADAAPSATASPALEQSLPVASRRAEAQEPLARAQAEPARRDKDTAAAEVGEDLAPVIAAIRARLATGTNALPAPAAPAYVDADKRERAAQGVAGAAAASRENAPAGKAALREILRLYEAGDLAEARAALARFRQDFPTDPIARPGP